MAQETDKIVDGMPLLPSTTLPYQFSLSVTVIAVIIIIIIFNTATQKLPIQLSSRTNCLNVKYRVSTLV